MKTKDFIREVEKLGFETANNTRDILIYDEYRKVAQVYKKEIFSVSTSYIFFDILSKELKEKLYNLMDKYVRTPIEEREEEQKYYLKHRKTNISSHYFNVFCGEDGHIVESNMDMVAFKSQFTQKEIDEIKDIFNTSFDEFKQIPVEEE